MPDEVIDKARILREEAVAHDAAGRPHEASRSMLRAFHALHVAGLDVPALGAMEEAAVYARRSGDREAVKRVFGEIVAGLRASEGDEFAGQVQAAMMAGLRRA